MSKAGVEDIKRFMLIQFRKTLRGERVTRNIERWLSGEFGQTHEFRVMNFDTKLSEEALAFVQDSKNREKLSAERIE